MTLKTKLLLVAIGIQMISIIYLKECKNGRSDDSGEVGSIRIGGLSGIRLPVHSNTGPTVGSNARRKERAEKVVYVPQESGVTIYPKDPEKKVEELVEFRFKNKGFSKVLGIKAAYPTYVGGDVKVAYYNRFGAEIGAGYAFERKKMDIDLGASYRLDSVLPIYNTEFYVGYGVFGQTYLVGFRINL